MGRRSSPLVIAHLGNYCADSDSSSADRSGSPRAASPTREENRGRHHLRARPQLPRPEDGPRLAGTRLRLRGHPWPSTDPMTIRPSCHYEMGYEGKGRIMVGGEWGDWTRSPLSTGGANTTSTHVTVARGIDAHCERARAGGAPRSWSSPPTSSTATACTAAPTSRATTGPSPCTCEDVTRAEAEEAIGPAHPGHQLAVTATLDATLAALADPIRRHTVDLLAERPPTRRRAG